ncbi:restriction endonuclease [Pseudoalteromonas sp. SR41-4]|uniref:nSTAND1 domain-containing NTPase n=1 Tax=Pseudoalteromonas sp. SR41-4 TaxID=2760950 RepID=UPI0016031ED2|nr:restriction endonuclease [Pseudoalteromonas sp. SR41-4]MBB1293398.1 ATP-binding protein [Pseudoalteromonas sp. SR41-4]
MLKEIVIWPTEENKGHERGAFFEKLANTIFTTQRYKVSGNIQFTGREFDLHCEHMDRSNERCLVECKAKQSLSSDEIKKFVFSASFDKFDFGYFLYTRSFERQVGGLIKEIQADDRYKNLYFWNAEKVIELLVASGSVADFVLNEKTLNVSKVILLYSYKGIYWVPILSSGTVPTHFSVLHGNDLSGLEDDALVHEIQDYIDEIQSLEVYQPRPLSNEKNEIVSRNLEIPDMETVTEIQSSDSWDDYKPASLKYFVGRKRQKDKIFGFLNDVKNDEIGKRVFYIDGKSGWGKSSLMSDLRERCRNQHYRKKYLSSVIDSRSANSNNFLPLAYELIINKAVKEKFIPEKYSDIKIPSAFDILGDKLSQELAEWLENESRVLVLIFDQFEDVFRKEGVFKSFYKFLLDINNLKSNIILGFSWKSEVNIPIENEAYHLWQQSRDHAFKITLDEFDSSESKSIIKQLEKDISEKFDIDFVRKVVDNSQGYPWLVKKLCIHIKKKVTQGLKVDDLYEQDFHVESLFQSDLEELSTDEVKALRFIAKRAFDDQALDITELDEVVKSETVQHLIHKRFVIKSGTKYNIYWDIFRDYLVQDKIPPIGETYLIRQPVNSVYEAFLAFAHGENLSIEEFMDKNTSSGAEGAALNKLRELRSIGLVNYKEGIYSVRVDNSDINKNYFQDYIHDKLEKHSFTLELRKIQGREINLSDLSNIIDTKIQSTKFANKTLEAYGQTFLSWLDFADVEIPNVSAAMMRRAKNALSYTPQMHPSDLEEFVVSVNNNYVLNKSKREQKLLYDSKSLGLLIYSTDSLTLTDFGEKAQRSTAIERKIIIANCAKKMEKISVAYDALAQDPSIKSRSFKNHISSILDGLNSQVYRNKTSRALYLWAMYIIETENEYNKAIQVTGA